MRILTPSPRTEESEREARRAVITTQILRLLDLLPGAVTMHVRDLWKDHYRVNVLTGQDALSHRITESYFIHVDDNGQILTSTPPVTRRMSDPQMLRSSL